MQFVRGELCSSVCFKFFFLTEEKKEEEEEDIIKKYYIFSTTRNDGMRRAPLSFGIGTLSQPFLPAANIVVST